MRKLDSHSATLLLGYNLKSNVRDHPNAKWGKVRRYQVSTMSGNGAVLYFDTKDQLEKWIEDVNEIRSMQYDGITLLDFMRTTERG